MVGTMAIDQPIENWTIQNPIFNMTEFWMFSDFEWSDFVRIWIMNIQIPETFKYLTFRGSSSQNHLKTGQIVRFSNGLQVLTILHIKIVLLNSLGLLNFPCYFVFWSVFGWSGSPTFKWHLKTRPFGVHTGLTRGQQRSLVAYWLSALGDHVLWVHFVSWCHIRRRAHLHICAMEYQQLVASCVYNTIVKL